MFRLVTLSVLTLGLPVMALADDAKIANCAATAGIVGDAVDERNGGNSQTGAIDFLT